MTTAWHNLTPGQQIAAACIATFTIGLVGVLALATAGVRLLIHLDTRRRHAEWGRVITAVDLGRADIDAGLQRLRHEVAAQMEPVDEYALAALRADLDAWGQS